MLKFLQTQRFSVILLVVGAVFVLISFFEVVDITKLQIRPLPRPQYVTVVLGILFCFISVGTYFFDELTFGRLGVSKISATKNGFSTKIGDSNISIVFGRIEQLADTSTESLIVLPANEFFDDECIRDRRSALGAYVNHRFANQTKKVEALIAKQLAGVEVTRVEKEAGVFRDSFGVGTGVFLKSLLNSNQPVLFLAVTTKRANEGLRAEMSYIFQAVQRIQYVIADNRIDSAYVPVMGAGHGGLKKEVALFGLLLAICDSVTNAAGHHIKEVNVVVFQADDNGKPSIPKAVCKRLLRSATSMYA